MHVKVGPQLSLKWRTYPVVINLLESFVADGSLEDDALESVAFVTGHQLHTDHLAFPNSHVAEYLPSPPREIEYLEGQLLYLA